MKRVSLWFLIMAGLVSAIPIYADTIEFLNPDISPENNLLFTARVNVPGQGAYDTLFSANAESRELTQLTVYPESVAVLDEGRRLQISNRFGVFVTDRGFSGLRPLEGFPSFVSGNGVQHGKLVASEPSPDGTMLLYLVPVSPARADLILFELDSQKKTVVGKAIEYSLNSFPACWSPDSRYFVYEKKAELFYFSIEQVKSGRVPDESWRKITDGRIGQVKWSRNSSLYLFRERSLYRIMPEEFFTQAIYAGIVPPGTMVGKSPFPYDSNFDEFWISPDGGKVILCKNGQNLFLFRLNPDDFGKEALVKAMPYMFLQGNTIISDIIWPFSDEVTIFTRSLRDGKRMSGAYRIKIPAEGQEGLSTGFEELAAIDAVSLALSPDENRIAVTSARGVTIRNYSSWKEERDIPSAGAMHSLWANNDQLIVAGSNTTEILSLRDSTKKLLAISQASQYGWATAQKDKVQLECASVFWENSPELSGWKKISSFLVNPPSTSSASYRVYMDELAAGLYKNTVMIRSAQGLGTVSLLPAAPRAYIPFPETDQKSLGSVFDHGSRIRRRELALVFNAYDNPEGLINILDTLKFFDIKASFFINGEFIRRNPGAARLIAESGHEIGNMFFSVFDATDARYKIDSEFIQRGLARTEDEYFGATGKELSLLWHSPHYAINSTLLEAAAKMNYTYIGRDIDPLDWVGRYHGTLSRSLYASAHEIVEQIVSDAKPGSIIPINLGVPEGGREDYLWNELGLLINALLAQGFDIVPVSTLMEHSK